MDPNYQQMNRPLYSGQRSVHSGPQPVPYDIGGHGGTRFPHQSVGSRFSQPSAQLMGNLPPNYQQSYQHSNLPPQPTYQSFQPAVQPSFQDIRQELERKDLEIGHLTKHIEDKYTIISQQKQTIEKLQERIQIMSDQKDLLSDRLSVVEGRLDPVSKWNMSHLPDLDQLIAEYKKSIADKPNDYGTIQILEKCEQISQVVHNIFYTRPPYLSKQPTPFIQQPGGHYAQGFQGSQFQQSQPMFQPGYSYSNPSQNIGGMNPRPN